MTDESILWFDALTKASAPIAGGKGANLGELARAGLPVPPGFVVTAPAFLAALDAAGAARADRRAVRGSERGRSGGARSGVDALGGRHPKELVAAGGADEFRAKMTASLLRITRAFHPRPVIYRTYDFGRTSSAASPAATSTSRSKTTR